MKTEFTLNCLSQFIARKPSNVAEIQTQLREIRDTTRNVVHYRRCNDMLADVQGILNNCDQPSC